MSRLGSARLTVHNMSYHLSLQFVQFDVFSPVGLLQNMKSYTNRTR